MEHAPVRNQREADELRHSRSSYEEEATHLRSMALRYLAEAMEYESSVEDINCRFATPPYLEKTL